MSISAFGSNIKSDVMYNSVADNLCETEKDEEHIDISESTTVNTSATSHLDEEDRYIKYYTDQDAIDIAKVLYRECGGVQSMTERACVAWTVLNRVDYDGSTIYSVTRTPNQFAFKESYPVWDDLLELAYDVLERWNMEKNGETEVGRVLPKDYMFFRGDGKHNYFRNGYKGSYDIWDYSLDSPYEN